MPMAKAAISSIAAINLDDIMKFADASKQKVLDAGGNMQCGGDEISLVEQKKIGESYVQAIVKNLEYNEIF